MSNLSLFTTGGALFLLRWTHLLAGVTWIGMLYYFNFVQGSFFAETDASTKSNAIQKLVPRALWWFRWGAMLTLLSGLCWYGLNGNFSMHNAPGLLIMFGMLFGFTMWFNVWFIIWPAQKLLIQSTTQVAQGGQAIPEAAARAARGGVASRTNTLLSLPMLFFMGAAPHLPLQMNPEANLMPLLVIFLLILAGIEFNALKGKTGPMTTVKGVIHCGVALTVVFYLLVEFLTK